MRCAYSPQCECQGLVCCLADDHTVSAHSSMTEKIKEKCPHDNTRASSSDSEPEDTSVCHPGSGVDRTGRAGAVVSCISAISAATAEVRAGTDQGRKGSQAPWYSTAPTHTNPTPMHPPVGRATQGQPRVDVPAHTAARGVRRCTLDRGCCDRSLRGHPPTRP